MLNNRPFSNVSVVGLGYIGLPTAAVLASRKMSVLGIDINPNIVDTINRGEIHFKEPELDMIVHAAVSEGYLRAALHPEPADVFIIAVPTPFKEDYQPDLSFVEAAVHAIAPFLKKGDLVILESTSPVGTTQKIAKWFQQARSDLTFPQTHQEHSDIRIAYCPERVLPGHVIHELVDNDRIIGGMTYQCAALAMTLYKTFVEGECIITNSQTAEMCKLTENSFRDVNIAFANELSMICDQLDINTLELIRLANRHPRVKILQPGAGVGGHCVAVDPWFIVSRNPEEARLIRTAREVNDSKPLWVVNKIMAAVDTVLKRHPSKTSKDVTIACLGLSFKPDIDDLRESPALQIAQEVAKIHSGLLYVIEPNISELPVSLSEMAQLTDLNDVVQESDILVKLVKHKEFNDLDEYMDQDKLILLDVSG